MTLREGEGLDTEGVGLPMWVLWVTVVPLGVLGLTGMALVVTGVLS